MVNTKIYDSAPQSIRDFIYYEQIVKGRSELTVKNYYNDLRTFFRFYKIRKKGASEEDFSKIMQSKKELSEGIFINTPDEKVNNFANYWLKHQVALCAEVGRDTGKGFRDQLQDAWAVASFNKELAKEKILETLTYMYQDGRCVRGWLPLDHHVYSDGPTWVAPTINAYIKETGDVDFLKTKVKYLDADGLPVKEDTVAASFEKFT